MEHLDRYRTTQFDIYKVFCLLNDTFLNWFRGADILMIKFPKKKVIVQPLRQKSLYIIVEIYSSLFKFWIAFKNIICHEWLLYRSYIRINALPIHSSIDCEEQSVGLSVCVSVYLSVCTLRLYGFYGYPKVICKVTAHDC